MLLPMSGKKHNRVLGKWEGYHVGRAQRVKTGGAEDCREVWIELLPNKRGGMVCSGCGRKAKVIHDITQRMVRDLPILGAKTWLFMQRRRVLCEHCGPRLERLSWLGWYQRVTDRLAEVVAHLCDFMPIKQVAEYFDLHWETVKTIHKRHLKAKLEPEDFSDVEVIGIDEFAIAKGQQYATVIVNVKSKRVLWVCAGRGREDIRLFFETLGQEGCQRLKAVVMDMNGAYEVEVRSQCPNAEIVYDLFHVLAKYGREVVDKVRAQEARRVKNDSPSKNVIKRSKWLLLRNKNNLGKQERVRLGDLLKANRNICKAYVLKEDLKTLWEYRYKKVAEKAWKQWFHRACCSRVEEIRKFAKRLKGYLPGILAHCRWPFHTSLLEGINNKIKVIKRMAYGYRDQEYFFLRIRAAFPGIP